MGISPDLWPFIAVTIILFVVVLGCVLPFHVSAPKLPTKRNKH